MKIYIIYFLKKYMFLILKLTNNYKLQFTKNLRIIHNNRNE